MRRLPSNSLFRVSEQTSQDARGHPDTAICCRSSTGHRSDKCCQIPPLNARSFDTGLFVAASICGDVVIWDVFEVEHCLLSKAVLAFNNDCPEDVAKSLVKLSVVYGSRDGQPLILHTLIFFRSSQGIDL